MHMNKNHIVYSILLLSLVFAMLTSCRKDPVFDKSSNIAVSIDHIVFDTVFSTIGSTTKMFYIKNTSDHAVMTDIFLAGGTSSNFRINVDGNDWNRIS